MTSVMAVMLVISLKICINEFLTLKTVIAHCIVLIEHLMPFGNK